MKYILFILITICISGCAQKYIEPADKEYATLSFPHNKTKYNFGFSGEIYNIAILNKNNCVDAWESVEDKSKDENYEVIKIPINKRIGIAAYLYVGNSSCTNHGFFEAEKGEHYILSAEVIKRACYMNLSKEINGQEEKIKIKPLFLRDRLCADDLITLENKKLIHLKENHAKLNFNGIKYILDSYIVMFENPYYITIERENEEKIDYQEAVDISMEYIKTRGCTSPQKHLPDLDKSNEDKTKWRIGVSC